MYILPALNEISDCSIPQLRFYSHAVPGVSKGRQVLKTHRFSPLCDFPKTTGASGVHKTQNETQSQQRVQYK